MLQWPQGVKKAALDGTHDGGRHDGWDSIEREDCPFKSL